MSDPNEDPTEDANPRRKRRWLRWLFISVLVAAAAPSLLTISGKQAVLLRLVNPKLNDAVSYRSAVLHWWAPVEVRELELADLSYQDPTESPDRPPLLTAQSVTTSKPLWRLVLSGGSGTRINFHDPVLNLAVRDATTNLEETLNNLQPENASAGATPPFEIRISNGAIRLHDSESQDEQRVGGIENITARISTLSGYELPEISLTADVGGHQYAVGQKGQATRYSPGTQIAASLDQTTADFPRVPQELTDRINDGPLGDSTIQVHLDAVADSDRQELTVSVRRVDCEDLAPVIRRFFPTVICAGRASVRIQTHIMAGKLSEGFAGRLQLLVEDLVWRQNEWVAGEAIRLKRFVASGVVAIAEDGLLLENFQVESELLNGHGSGEVRYQPLDPGVAMKNASESANHGIRPGAAVAEAASHGSVRLDGVIDLAAISRMIPETLGVKPEIEISEADLAFGIRILQSERPQSDGLDLSPQPRDFQWRLNMQSSPIKGFDGRRSVYLKSPLSLQANGQFDLRSGNLEAVRLHGDFGEVNVQPLKSGYAVSAEIVPDQLWEDLSSFVTVTRPGIRGTITLKAALTSQGSVHQFSDVRLTANGLEAISDRFTVSTDRQLTEMFDGAFVMRGDAMAVKTVISPWHDATWLSDSSQVAVRIDARSGDELHIKAAVRPASHLGSHSRSDSGLIDECQLEASLITDGQTGGVFVERGQLEIPGLSAALSGTLGSREDLLHVNLEAQTTYDLSRLSPRLLSRDGSIFLTGSGTEQFTIIGSPAILTNDDLVRHRRTLSPDQSGQSAEPLSITGGFGWDGGRFLEANVGPGRAIAELSNGVIRTQPIQCAFAEGDLNFMAQWNIPSNVIELGAGARIQNLTVPPQLAAAWVGYLAPMLSDATRIEGRISARLQRFAWFIDTPSRSHIEGTLTIHDAVASAGPSLGSIVQLLSVVSKKDLSQRAVVVPPQNVALRLSNEFLAHDRLSMELNEYVLHTSGKVGLNEQVQLTLDVPLEKGINARRVSVPVRGTIKRPMPDTAGLLQNIGRQEIESRVKNKLNDEINKGLKGLLEKIR